MFNGALAIQTMRMYNTNVLLLRHGEVGGRTSLVIELEENGAIAMYNQCYGAQQL